MAKRKDTRASLMKHIAIMDEVKQVKLLPVLDMLTISGAAEYLETEPQFISSYYASHLAELKEYGAVKLTTQDFQDAGYTMEPGKFGNAFTLHYGDATVNVGSTGARCLTKTALFNMILGLNCSEVAKRINTAVAEAEAKEHCVPAVQEAPESLAVYRASEIQTFTNTEFGSVRVVDINGEPWFVGKDVADVLGYVDAKQAVRDHVFENDKLGVELTTNFGKKKTWCINEYGIYQLVISSQLPSARKFQYWVTHEVLPSIRKYGAYMTPQTLEAAILNPDTLIKVCMQLKAEQEKNRELEAINRAMADELNTWDKRTVLLTMIRSLSGKVFQSDFARGFTYFYQQFNNKYHTNLKSRKPSNSKKPIIDFMTESEFENAVKLATAICMDNGVDLKLLLNSTNAANLGVQ